MAASTPSPWVSIAVAVVGMAMLAAFAADRILSGKPGDPTLVSAALALSGLGIGVTLDRLRRRNGS